MYTRSSFIIIDVLWAEDREWVKNIEMERSKKENPLKEKGSNAEWGEDKEKALES